jgi:hypothetical protein
MAGAAGAAGAAGRQVRRYWQAQLVQQELRAQRERQGQSGAAGAGAYGNPLTTQGLITHPRRIVGTWTDPTWTVPSPDPENDNNLERWEPWVRAEVLDFELMSHLQFTPMPEEDSPLARRSKCRWETRRRRIGHNK